MESTSQRGEDSISKKLLGLSKAHTDGSVINMVH